MSNQLKFYIFQSLASSAITGIMVGLFSAWPILIFTTLNFVIGTLAVITIGLVTACVVGMIPLVGWKLGVSVDWCKPEDDGRFDALSFN